MVLWFLSSVLPFINIYVCTKFNFNPFSTFQDMARISNHYEKWLREDNSINNQGRVMVLVHCPSSHCHLYITNSHWNANSSFKVICQTRYRMDRQTDRQSRLYVFPFGEHKNTKATTNELGSLFVNGRNSRSIFIVQLYKLPIPLNANLEKLSTGSSLCSSGKNTEQ